jgi:gamma-glutamyltranspeptidase/glutathione hydrolase
MVSMTTEPGVISIGGGGFVNIWAPGRDPVVYDGNMTMPGLGQSEDRFGRGAWEVTLDYGGGVSTFIGHGSVAMAGGMAVLDAGWKEFGSLPWRTLTKPAYEHARDGFPMPQASRTYLVHSAEQIFGWHHDSRQALFDDEGVLAEIGRTIHVPHLADSLDVIAREGASALYSGSIARLIAEDMARNEGLITARDLAEYKPVVRRPLTHGMGDWTIATNPAPAVGGVTLCALLALMRDRPHSAWTAEDVALATDAQRAVFGYRRTQLDLSDDIDADARRLMQLCQTLEPAALLSPSTIHVSTVDETGMACAVTMSSGYGSGVMPPGTGIWLNNCLGEVEVNRRGLVPGPPGTLLTSNMAPSIARHADSTILAIGSPGADRITTALMMTLLNLTQLDMTMEDAIAHPRLHIELVDSQPRLAVEPGLDTSLCTVPVRHYDHQSMFFGGVGAARLDSDGQLHAASDSRRTGGARIDG